MLFRLGVIVLACGLASAAGAQQLRLEHLNRVLSNKDLRFLGDQVRAQGYPCRRAERGVYLGQEERGRFFRITCDSEKFSYKIEQEGKRQFRIEFEQ